jgi:hypothetical protein
VNQTFRAIAERLGKGGALRDATSDRAASTVASGVGVGIPDSTACGPEAIGKLSVGERRALVLHELEGRRPTKEAAAARKQ